MSTDYQQYSLDNQADAISRYATDHDFLIVKTYSDAARSGLRLKNRTGLKQLLKDVVDGQVEYRAVLVYDVSRWGRFQDADEAAHYEYLCKSSGVPVHYCAELFSNDNSMSGWILKAVKRTMAGEYSRELSVKVRTGLFKLAKLGYKLGGSAVYGLRRQLLDVEGRPKQLLGDGEYKSISKERVVLVPGPQNEIATVRRIFHEFADEDRSPNAITARLNREGIPHLRGAKWRACTVRNILQDTHYLGLQVWGRTSAFLSGPVKRLPSENWAICPKAFEPIIAQDLFVRAQRRFANLTCRLSDEQLLERVKCVLKSHGKLTTKLIGQSHICPAANTLYLRFGGLLNLYAQLGYSRPEQTGTIATRARIMLIRRELVNSLLENFPNQLEGTHRGLRFRSRLREIRSGLLIGIMVARCWPTKKGELRWILDYGVIPEEERNGVTVLALLDDENAAIKDLKIFLKMDFPGKHTYQREDSKWLRSGAPLQRISEFLDVLHRIRTDRCP